MDDTVLNISHVCTYLCSILVRIDGWEMDSQYPHGHFVKSLGRAGDLETEIATILHENELSACPFAEKQV